MSPPKGTSLTSQSKVSPFCHCHTNAVFFVALVTLSNYFAYLSIVSLPTAECKALGRLSGSSWAPTCKAVPDAEQVCSIYCCVTNTTPNLVAYNSSHHLSSMVSVGEERDVLGWAVLSGFVFSASLQHGSLRTVGLLTRQLKALRACVPAKQAEVTSSVPVMTSPCRLVSFLQYCY